MRDNTSSADTGQFWEQLYAGREARPLDAAANAVLVDVLTSLGDELSRQIITADPLCTS